MSSSNSLASQQSKSSSEIKIGVLNKTREQLSCLNLGNNNNESVTAAAATTAATTTTATSSLDVPHQQRQQITDKNYRVRDTRRNSVLIDKPNKRRLSQQKENNLLLSPGGSNQLQAPSSPQQTTQTQRQRQRTQESYLDYINSVDCT
jgi:hypothetical protein